MTIERKFEKKFTFKMDDEWFEEQPCDTDDALAELVRVLESGPCQRSEVIGIDTDDPKSVHLKLRTGYAKDYIEAVLRLSECVARDKKRHGL